jgi:hypothetical protein
MLKIWLKRLAFLCVAVVLTPAILVFVAAAVLAVGLRAIVLYLLVWTWWIGPARQRVLVVYSESPIWQEHMEREIVPRLPPRTVVLNWSQRKQWSRLSFPVLLFDAFTGRREFNPIVLVFRRFSLVERFRFWRPFHDAKHGHADALRVLELQLFERVRE